MLNVSNVEGYLHTALGAIRAGSGFAAVIDALPVPIYTTDAEGTVTYWNRACIDFAGRVPEPGDRWCVTWHLYTTHGESLPHEQCPMAEAIRQKRPIRNAVAIAARPDGSRVAFTPYPTPLFDESGNLSGAVNMLIDISDEQVGALSEQANRCRRLSRATHDQSAAGLLTQMASGYDETAAALRKQHSS